MKIKAYFFNLYFSIPTILGGNEFSKTLVRRKKKKKNFARIKGNVFET